MNFSNCIFIISQYTACILNKNQCDISTFITNINLNLLTEYDRSNEPAEGRRSSPYTSNIQLCIHKNTYIHNMYVCEFVQPSQYG